MTPQEYFAQKKASGVRMNAAVTGAKPKDVISDVEMRKLSPDTSQETQGADNFQDSKPSSSFGMWSALTGADKKLQQAANPFAPGNIDPESGAETGLSSFTKTMGKAVANTALQPARFIERTGRGIGEAVAKNVKLPFEEGIANRIGLNKDNSAGFEKASKEGLQEQVGGSEYATPAYKSGKQVLGGGLQAAANLATPFVKNPVGMGLQGAALAGGKTLEEGGSYGDAALNATIGAATSYGLGKGGQFLGDVLTKGKQAAYDALKPFARKLTSFTGLTKKEAALAFDELPQVTAKKLAIINDAADPADAEARLQSDLLSKVRTTVVKAKEKAGAALDNTIKNLQAAFPDARADVPAVAKKVIDELPRFGRPKTADEQLALKGVLEILQEPREYTLQGTRTLLSDLWDHASGLQEGTPARRAAMSAWSDLRQELSKMTQGKIDPAMQAYSTFMDHYSELRPVWSNNVDENMSRSFVSNLTSSAKTASRDALKYMEAVTPETTLKEGSVIPELTIHRLMKKLASDTKLTGGRLGELLLAGGVYTAGGALGEAVGGEKGKGVAQLGAGLLAGKALAPAALSKVLLSGFEEAGVKTTSAIRNEIAKVISNPQAAQALWRTLNSMFNKNNSENVNQE